MRLRALALVCVALLAAGALASRITGEDVSEGTTRSRDGAPSPDSPPNAGGAAGLPAVAASSAAGSPDAPAPGSATPEPEAATRRSGLPDPARLASTPPRSRQQPRIDLFPAPLPPKPVAEAQVAPPAPPPPPPRPSFALIGRVLDGPDTIAVMRDGERVLTLRAGDRQGGWIVAGVSDAGATLIHEASGRSTVLAFAAAAGTPLQRPTASDAAAATGSAGAARD